MKPLFFTLHTKLDLMILPDTLAHLNGHTVITETYSIFKNTGSRWEPIAHTRESELHLEHTKYPDYLGYLRFDVPGKLFTYTAADHTGLNSYEINELIELLSEIRGNPKLWKF